MERANLGRRDIFNADVHNDRFLFGGNLGMRRELFFEAGRFNEDMRIGEDIDLCKRLYRAGKSIVYNPEMAVYHNHKETIMARFRKAFGYGVLQAKFLREYLGPELQISLSARRVFSFKFPFRVRLHVFSILTLLLAAAAVFFINTNIAILLVLFLALGINAKVFAIVVKSGRKVNIVVYILMLLLWSSERLVFDLGRIAGAFKYKVVCV